MKHLYLAGLISLFAVSNAWAQTGKDDIVDFGEPQPLTIVTADGEHCLLYTSPSPRDQRGSRMPSSA